MLSAIEVLIPIFIVIAVGWLLKQRNFPGEAFWPLLDKLVYYIVFPALLVRSLARADLAELEVLPLLAAILGVIFAMVGIGLIARPLLGVTGRAFSSVLQGLIRMNTYAGFAVAGGLYGTVGVTLFSVIVTFAIPTANILSIAGLSVFARTGPLRWRHVVAELARNPLIIAVLIGAIVNITGIGLPWVLAPVLDFLGDAALPLALLSVGAGLNLGAIRATGSIVVATTELRMLLAPILAMAMAWLLGIEGVTRAALVIYATLPVSPAAYILARQLGGDSELMAAIIAATTIAGLMTLPLWLTLLL